MVVRVVDPGPDDSVVKEVVCGGCGAKLEYTPNDVQSQVYTDITQCSDTYCWIVCPQCNKNVTVIG